MKNNEALICPITGEIMCDPVMDQEGNSYDKAAILEWLSKNASSPITRNPLRIDQLTPNRALRDVLLLLDDNKSNTDDVKMLPSRSVPDIGASIVVTSNDGYSLLKLSLADDNGNTRQPAFIICVLDVSHSMDDAAVMHSDREGGFGLSLLDIVKHATRTVIESLSSLDTLAIVAYADTSQVILPPTKMIEANRANAWERVNALVTCGSTNLWDGIASALKLVLLEEVNMANVIVLTDGQPNIRPPRGEVESIRQFKGRHPALSCTISTFGFGYRLDSALLQEIAVVGKGHFCFIPDSSFVGTVFVNMTSNILATALAPSSLDLELNEGFEIDENMSGLPVHKTSWGFSIELPQIIYGQTLNILFKVNGIKMGESPFRATWHLGGRTGSIITCAEVISNRDMIAAPSLAYNISKLISNCEGQEQGNWISVHQAAKEQIERVNTKFRFVAAHDEKVKTLLQDLNGQVVEAYSLEENHKRWGRHYLLSLARAHVMQQCTNFKDPGVQGYATKKFDKIREIIEETFIRLPPPKPSREVDPSFGTVHSMTRYYNRNDVCFAKGSVALADGTFVDVSQIRAGDVVVTSGEAARVRCVVKTLCEGGVQKLVELDSSVLVTSWHPIRSIGSSAWSFPAEINAPELRDCSCVFSFVLEEGTFMQIGPYEAVVLGHGIHDDKVASHPFLGTNLVVDNLSRLVGWSEGLIVLGKNPTVRDPVTNLITAFIQDEAAPKLPAD